MANARNLSLFLVVLPLPQYNRAKGMIVQPKGQLYSIHPTDCLMMLALSSWLSALSETSVCCAVYPLYYLYINCEAHGVAAAVHQS